MLRRIAVSLFLLLSPLSLLKAAPFEVNKAASEFRVDVKATGHSFEVFLNDYATSIDLSESGELKAAEFSFACVDLKSDNKKRDKKMLGWLESDSLPQISFKLKEVQKRDSGLVGIGELSLHGMTRSVEVPFSVAMEGDKATLSGTATVDHTEYGLEVITMFFMKVNPELKISFNLVGTLES